MTTYCTNCGKQADVNFKFCGYCGQSLTTMPELFEEESPVSHTKYKRANFKRAKPERADFKNKPVHDYAAVYLLLGIIILAAGLFFYRYTSAAVSSGNAGLGAGWIFSNVSRQDVPLVHTAVIGAIICGSILGIVGLFMIIFKLARKH
jgi:hypothetical protein